MNDDMLLLSAMLRRDWATYELMMAEFHERGKGTPVAAIGFAFDMATKARFAASRSHANVISFVADARAFFPDGKDIDPTVAEALICATLDLDEPGLMEMIDSLDVGVIVETEGQLLFKMVHDRQMSDQEIDAFLRDVEIRANHWQADHA